MKLPTSAIAQRIRNASLLIASAILLAASAAHFLAWRNQANSIDTLSRQAFAEAREFWETGEGEDPQVRWQQRFWEIFETSEDPQEREKAGLLALSMLSNMEEWERFKGLHSSLDRNDPVFERSLSMAKTAYLKGAGGESAYISFLSGIIREGPDDRIAATVQRRLQVLLAPVRQSVAVMVVRNLDSLAFAVQAEAAMSMQDRRAAWILRPKASL